MRRPVLSGQAVKIMTGAQIPKGADAVVMREQTLANNGIGVRIFHAPRSGEFIRRQGEDIRRRSLLAKKGTRIRPFEISLLASQGIRAVPVFKRPRIAVVATGDELVEGDRPVPVGGIRNANSPAIASALSRWNLPCVDLGIVRDDRTSAKRKFRKALDIADVALISGGVSGGDFDYTKSLLEELGIRKVFWRVAVRPGKPLFFGVSSSGTRRPAKLVFGLPGNPLSVLVCLEEFVRPALERMEGVETQPAKYLLKGRVSNTFSKPEDRQQFLFCRALSTSQGMRIEIIKPQASHMTAMAGKANALAIAPVGVARIRPGDELAFRWLE